MMKQQIFQFPGKKNKNPTLFIRKWKKPDSGVERNIRRKPKPEWIKQEVVRLKAFMGNDGYRKIAYTFNRLYSEKNKAAPKNFPPRQRSCLYIETLPSRIMDIGNKAPTDRGLLPVAKNCKSKFLTDCTAMLTRRVKGMDA